MSLPVAQDFIVDPSLVQNATEVAVSSVNLYCKSKPASIGNASGIIDPGVTLYIVPTTSDGLPITDNITSYASARREYAEIVGSIDASAATNFRFSKPPTIQTGVPYAYILKFDGNSEYEFWGYTVGDVNVVTKTAATSLGNQFLGKFYELTSDSANWRALSATVQKFQINLCRFAINGQPAVAGSDTFQLHIGDYEFIEYDIAGSIGLPMGGEHMYMQKPSPDGTCSVAVGNSSVVVNSVPFSTWYSNPAEPRWLVITSAGYTNIRQVVTFSGSTATLDAPVSFTNAAANFYATTPVGVAYISGNSVANNGVRRSLFLANSTANSSVRFANGYPIIGEVSGCFLANCTITNVPVTDVSPHIYVNVPAGSSYNARDVLNYTTPDGSAVAQDPHSMSVEMFKDNIITYSNTTFLLSRSNEVALVAGSLASDPANSSIIDIDVISTNDFMMPSIAGSPDVYYTRYFINNDYSGENTKYGNAISKALSSRVSLGAGMFAEDMLVYVNAYRPAGTDVKVLVKFYNSADPDAFDDKDWTLLQCTAGNTKFSSVTTKNDVNEYTYGLVPSPNTNFTYAGTVTLSNTSPNAVASAPIFGSNTSIGDLVKIYQPLFPKDDYVVASITNVVNSTVVTLDQIFTNNSVIGAGLSIDHLGYPFQAFQNKNNSNVIRYYDSNLGYHDTYDSFAVKVVFLSNSNIMIPYISSVRAIAVSA